jgi:hypothetical protein
MEPAERPPALGEGGEGARGHASARSTTSGRRTGGGGRAGQASAATEPAGWPPALREKGEGEGLEGGREPESRPVAGVREFYGQRSATTIELGERPIAKIGLEANIVSPLVLAVVALRIGGGEPWWLSGWHGGTGRGH